MSREALISSHLSHRLADAWGTTVDFTTSFLNFSRFSAFRSMGYDKSSVRIGVVVWVRTIVRSLNMGWSRDGAVNWLFIGCLHCKTTTKTNMKTKKHPPKTTTTTTTKPTSTHTNTNILKSCLFEKDGQSLESLEQHRSTHICMFTGWHTLHFQLKHLTLSQKYSSVLSDVLMPSKLLPCKEPRTAVRLLTFRCHVADRHWFVRHWLFPSVSKLKGRQGRGNEGNFESGQNKSKV